MEGMLSLWNNDDSKHRDQLVVTEPLEISMLNWLPFMNYSSNLLSLIFFDISRDSGLQRDLAVNDYK